MTGKGLTDHLSSRLPAGVCSTLFPGDDRVQSLEDIGKHHPQARLDSVTTCPFPDFSTWICTRRRDDCISCFSLSQE